MTVEQYDRVRLSDGRTCTIVDILKAGYAYIADLDLPGPDWETIEIQQNDIAGIIE